MAKLGIVLAVYAAAACVGLAFVYAGTKDQIDKNQKAVMEEALGDLFPGADFDTIQNFRMTDNFVTIDADKNDPSNTGVFAARQNGALVGLAVRTSRGGFGGPVKLLVGVGTDGKIMGVKILEHSETPGLGANLSKPIFINQFAGKPANDSFTVKQDVDAITASTITSRAVSDSVKAAGLAAVEWMKENGGSR